MIMKIKAALSVSALLVLTLLLTARVAYADWLVTQAGERIETRGGWQIKGRMVVFTGTNGTLQSLRSADIDLDASNAATEEAAAVAAAPPPAPPQAPPPKKASRKITTEDVGEGQVGAEGTDLLIERLQLAHRYQDASLATSLVNWQDVPETMHKDIESQFEWMMDQRIRNIRFVPREPEEIDFEKVQDEIAYEPNLEVAGKIEIDFVPKPDEAEVLLTFFVGTRLGSYFIAAPREAAE